MSNNKDLYNNSKSAKIGSTCKCPSCNTEFIKSNYQQAFCKSKKGTICKDKYWNMVTPEKRNNTTRISPANALWMMRNDTPVILGHSNSQRAIDTEERLEMELNDDGSWDNHQCFVEKCEWCKCLICRCDN
jgi:hypothetical protein